MSEQKEAVALVAMDAKEKALWDAAPKILDTLKSINALIANYDKHGDSPNTVLGFIRDTATNAVAKAEGQ